MKTVVLMLDDQITGHNMLCYLPQHEISMQLFRIIRI
jgi:hypothetical protein